MDEAWSKGIITCTINEQKCSISFLKDCEEIIQSNLGSGVFTKPVNIRLPFVLKRSAKAMHAFINKKVEGDPAKETEDTVKHGSEKKQSSANGDSDGLLTKTTGV